MSSPVIRIHVGAHKTATTYIQDTLALNQAASAAAGTATWTRAQFRPALAAAITAQREKQRTRTAYLKPSLGQRCEETVDALRGFFEVDRDVTISEENLLGYPKDSWSGTLYPRASETLDRLSPALEGHRVEIYLAVRSYPAFISSLYGEALQQGNHRPIESYKRMHRSADGLWPRVVETLQGAFPDSCITVWQYEDFARLEPEVLGRLSGLARDAIIKPAQTDILPSASAQAIEEYAQTAADMPRSQRQFHMLALRHKHPKSGPNAAFSLWNDAEAAALRDEYEADLARIKTVDAVEFLNGNSTALDAAR
ncbi:MAG: hypothetical protein AAFQ34_10485 [Pseudomonadota bacterium]